MYTQHIHIYDQESGTIMAITLEIILSSKCNDVTLRNIAINIYIAMNSMG